MRQLVMLSTKLECNNQMNSRYRLIVYSHINLDTSNLHVCNYMYCVRVSTVSKLKLDVC